MTIRIREVKPQVDPDEVKKSRHNRRLALKNTMDAVNEGWVMLSGIPYEFDQAFRRLAPGCVSQKPTYYYDYRRPTEVRQQDWYRSPIEGVTARQIFQLAVSQYQNDPEERYRVPYTIKLILQSDPDTILTELMMYELAGDV